MTLQSSGAISLLDVQNEFGGSNPIGINEYYGVAAGVPSSGTISLYDFYGKSAVPPFSWTYNIMGYEYVSSTSFSSIYAGNIITPGSSASPVNLVINSTTNGNGYFSIYIGGSLAYTFSGPLSNYQHTSTFGSSTYQFRSEVVDYTSNNGGNILTVFVGGTQVYYHEQDLLRD